MSATQIEGDLMNSVSKLVARMGLLSLLSVMPLAAQIDNGVDFTTTFPFYAGSTRMPAGFHKYGDTDYLNRIWVNGQKYGMKVDPTKAETKAAASTNVVEHSLVADKR